MPSADTTRPDQRPTPPVGTWDFPADILIDQAGIVLAFKHGTHAYDQCSVDDLLQLAAIHA